MIIGAYGRFWEESLVDWSAPRGWRLLGRRGLNAGTIEVADFRYARGVYVLYNNVGAHYVGLTSAESGLGHRIKQHRGDHLAGNWTRFSWFSFDFPSDAPEADGILGIDQYGSIDETESKVVIRDLEALLIAAIDPAANVQRTKFHAAGDEWIQVATRRPEIRTLDSLKGRLV